MLSNVGISVADYGQGNYRGFGQAFTTQQDLSELHKAMTADQITGTQTLGLDLTGAPLKTESLEKTLKVLEFREQDIRLWKRIPKLPAFNTVEEYVQLKSYGGLVGGFWKEGELPDESDSTYVRQAELIKYLGVTGEVTHQATLVKSIIDIYRQEINNKAMEILRINNQGLTKADSSIVPEEYNGLYKQHQDIGGLYPTLQDYYSSDVVIDLRGRSLTQADVATSSRVILEKFGYANLLYAPPIVIEDLASDYFQRQRIIMGGGPTGGYQGTIGTVPQSISTTTGNLELQHDLFMQTAPPRKLTTPADSTKAPNPVIVNNPPAAVADPLSQFEAGDYYFAVAPINRYGQGTLTIMDGAATTVAAGQAVDLDFQDGGGAIPATGYVIYISLKDDPTPNVNDILFYPVFKVSLQDLAAGYDGGAPGIIRDRQRIIANTQQAFSIQANDQVWSFKQLAPLMKMNLAILSPAFRFMVLLYGTPFLYAKEKMVRFINIGRFVQP